MSELLWWRNQESISRLAMIDWILHLALYQLTQPKHNRNITDAVDTSKF